MESALILLIISCLLILGSIVLIGKYKDNINILFFFITLLASLWILTNYFSNITTDYDLSLIFNKFIFSITTVLIYVLYLFSTVYPKHSKIKTSLFPIFGLIVTIFVTLLGLTNNIVKDIYILENHSEIQFGFGIYIYLSHFGLFSTLFVYRILNSYKIAVDTEKTKIQYLIIGITISLFGTSITNIIFPIFFNNFSLSNIGPAFLLFFILFTTISIMRYRLFGIRYILGRILFFSIISIYPGIFFLGIYYLLGINQKYLVSWKEAFFYLILVLLFSSTNLVLTNKIRPFFLEDFTFGGYNPTKKIKEYMAKINNSLEMDVIGREVTKMLTDILDIEKAQLVILNKKGEKIVYNSAKEIIQKEKEMQKQEILLKYINGSNKIISKDLDPIIKDILVEENLDLLFKFEKDLGLTGFIALGQRKERKPYNLEEIHLIEDIVSNISPAIGRALLYRETESFNQTLQLKVNEQTKELQTKILELEEARKKEADMIDIMGHELRTPATIVKLNADLLHKFIDKIPEDKESFAKYVSRIKDAVENEIRLINTLLTSAKLEGDKIEINPERIDLFKEIDMAVHGEELNALNKGIQLINNVSSNISNIYADRARIVEVLNNLISNAVKYTEKGGVTINGIDEGEFVKISVSDTGSGMSKEDLDKIGTKFYRAKTYIQSDQSDDFDIVRPGGTGLGLYVTFNLIRKMGGDIKVQSELGKGSTFTFTLPKYMNQSKTITEPNTNDMFVRIGLK